MLEEWRDIPNCSGYQVSNLGRLRSIDRTVVFRDGRIYKYRGQLLKPTDCPNGYLYARLGSARMTLHKTVLLSFEGPAPEGFVCRHLDGVRKNCRLDNLAYSSYSVNIQDRSHHGTNAPVKSGHRFTPENVQYIRSSSKSGAELAQEYGCVRSTIYAIRRRESYRLIS